MGTKTTGAALLVELLKQAGVRLLFGLPGDTSVAFYEVLYHQHFQLRHIVARDERHAAYMADGAARVTKQRMVVEASSGGGAAYLASGLVEAYAASVPILAIISDIHQDSQGSGALTEFPVDTLLQGTTRAVLRIDRVHQLPQAFQTLWQWRGAQRPAPAALIVPENLWEEPVPGGNKASQYGELPKGDLGASPAAVEQAAQWLATARHPAIVAGGGVHWAEAYQALQALAETYQLPVATTIHGKGALPETHPLCLGVAGANGGHPATNAYLAQADVVLLVGTRANATDTLGFRAPPRYGPRIIQIDIDPQRAGANYPGALPLVGNAKVVLEQLTDALSQAGSRSKPEYLAQITEVRKQRMTAPPLGSGPVLSAHWVVQQVHRLAMAHPGVIVVGDPGTPTPYLAAYWTLAQAGRTVILPRGVGPMGYAIPAGIGIALACSQQPVLVFTTEGSMAMAAGELETAVRYQLPILFLQLTNHAYSWIQMLQHLYYEKHYFGVDLRPVDSVQLARSMGMEADRITNPTQLVQRVQQFFQQGRPQWLEIPVRSLIEEVPPVQPWLEAQQGRRERPIY